MAFAGVAYRAQWQGRGDFTFGVQQESYDKNVLSPDLPAARLTDHPLRAYGDAALALGELPRGSSADYSGPHRQSTSVLYVDRKDSRLARRSPRGQPYKPKSLDRIDPVATGARRTTLDCASQSPALPDEIVDQ
jgi:hypothetical protein